jgi:hypothetical protein
MSDEQNDQRPLSPRSFAGLAAAAIGVLAARCKPISSNGAQRLLRLQRADTGASDLCTTECATAAEASAGSHGEDGADTDTAGAAGSWQPRMQPKIVPFMPLSSSCQAAHAAGDGSTAASCRGDSVRGPSSSQVASPAAAPAGASSSAAGDAAVAPEASISPVLPSAADASARVLLGDKVPAPPAAAAAAGPAGVAGGAAAAAGAGPASVAGGAAAPAAAANADAAAGKEGLSSSHLVMYSNRTVVLTFTDPTLPYQLSKLVKVRHSGMR